jgi:hypothetical protein
MRLKRPILGRVKSKGEFCFDKRPIYNITCLK